MAIAGQDSAGVIGDRASHSGNTPAPGSRRTALHWYGSPALLDAGARSLPGATVGRRPVADRQPAFSPNPHRQHHSQMVMNVPYYLFHSIRT